MTASRSNARILEMLVAGALFAVNCSSLTWGQDSDSIRFNRDIRPLLSEYCFQCHGPDSAARAADLRLDDRQSVLLARNGNPTVLPGDSATSELYRRITSEDPQVRMPPASTGRQLSAEQTQLLQSWIQQGAEYEPHWSFVAPQRPMVPRINAVEWSRHPIDNFVLNKIERFEMSPSVQAAPSELIRRVTLDLTGLPPNVDELADFELAGSGTDDDVSSPDSYERLVDRLLASQHYGERMAVEWLDAARYADTHGYLFDTERSMWRWRDWVIAAYNQNLSFDQFTIEQLAGDLIPNASLSQQIASGFNRNHIINNEAGAIPEEYLVENVVDRVNTTATIWMGLSLACAQCHDHKYDPVTQREYYELYSFFNNVTEVGLDGFNANAKPIVSAPTDLQELERVAWSQKLRAAEDEFAPLEAQIAAAQESWERDSLRLEAEPEHCLVVHLPFDSHTIDTTAADRGTEFKDGIAAYESGILGQAAAMDGQRYVESGNAADFDANDSFTLGAWIYPTSIDGRRAVFSRMEPGEAGFRGYTLQIVGGSASLFLVHQFPENLLQVQARKPLEAHRWYHLLATYDGSGKAEGVKIYVNGVNQEVDLIINSLTKPIRTDKALWIGKGHPGAKFLGRIDEARIYQRELSANEVAELPGVSIQSLLAVDRAARNEEQHQRIRSYYLENAAPETWRTPYDKIVEIRKAQKEMERRLPTSMVMQERTEPRETHILVRGAYNRPGDLVVSNTPAFLPPLHASLPRNRWGFAQWLVDERHPLTARVAVNRFWQMRFGNGIVATTENFGLQGESPTHPELLDWLAIAFMRMGWDTKRLQRLLVLTATYRQSSRVTKELLERDPENRWLTRGPRQRLQAEFVRDVALDISGLLVNRVGGPSVKPYMPADVWREVAFDPAGATLTAQVYLQDRGEALYRRGMYTFWKRTAPPPAMLLFDGPDRERCIVRRDRTNTPLQALVTMNDPTFVEAARKLAERMLTEGGDDLKSKLKWGFHLTTARNPRAQELDALLRLHSDQMVRFRQFDAAAKELLQVGESPANAALPTDSLAALAVVANVLLNLDETLTRQ